MNKGLKILMIIFIATILVCGCDKNNKKEDIKKNTEITNKEEIKENESNENNNEEPEPDNNELESPNNESTIEEPKTNDKQNNTNNQNNESKNESTNKKPVVEEPTPVIPDSYKTLTCTLNENDELISSKQVVTITFKNNEMYKLNITENIYILNDELKDPDTWDLFINEVENELNNEFESLKSMKGVSIVNQSNKNDYSYNIKMDFDITNMSKDSIIELEFDSILNSDNQPEQAMIDFLNDGYSCR